MTEIRCVKCQRLLMKAVKAEGVEVKCPKCGYLNKVTTIKLGEIDVNVVVDDTMPAGAWMMKQVRP